MKENKTYVVILHQEGGCDYMMTTCGTEVFKVSATSEEEAMSQVMYDLFFLERGADGKAEYLLEEKCGYLVDVFEVKETPAKAMLKDMIKTATDEINDRARENVLKKKRAELERLQEELGELEGS